MKKSEEFMKEFMYTLRNVAKYQNIRLNPMEPNYDEFEKAFSEEKKIVATYSQNNEAKLDKNLKVQRKKDDCFTR